MNSRKFSFVLLAALIALTGLSTVGQDAVFSDPNVDYSFVLPDAKWKMTVKPSATSPNVEYVYGDRVFGRLQVRRLVVAKDAILSEVVRREEPGLQFQDGFVAGKDENFAGKLKGMIFNYEFVERARSMSGRFYFLRANDTTVYVLRFTGEKDSIRSTRAQTDSIARTFGVKP